MDVKEFEKEFRRTAMGAKFERQPNGMMGLTGGEKILNTSVLEQFKEPEVPPADLARAWALGVCFLNHEQPDVLTTEQLMLAVAVNAKNVKPFKQYAIEYFLRENSARVDADSERPAEALPADETPLPGS